MNKHSPIILAIDTSTDVMTVVLSRGDQILVEVSKPEKHHTRKLLSTIDECLKKSKISIADIDAFSTTIGPGSFTGIRTSLGTIKAMAYTYRQPIIAIPTLQAMVESYDSKETIVPTLPARKDHIYMALYEYKHNEWIETVPVKMIPTDTLPKEIPAKAFVIGSQGNSEFDRVYGTNLSKISLRKYMNNEFEDVFSLEPLYIQKTAAEGYV